MKRPQVAFTKFCFIILLAAVSALFSDARADFIDGQEYEAIRGISTEILERFPPEEFIYVGVGRSPTALVAFLQLIAPSQAINVPLSGANGANKYLETAAKDVAVHGTDPYYLKRLENFEKVLDRHFDAFLKPALSSGKKILFMDYVVNGSFESALKLVDHYLKKQPASPSFDFVSIASDRDIHSNSAWLPAEKNISLSNYPHEFKRRLEVSHYEQVAEFEGWNPGLFPDVNAPLPKENPNYPIFKKMLFKKMSEDSSLNLRWAIHKQFCAKHLLPE